MLTSKGAKITDMADETDNLVPEHLRAIRAELGDLKTDMGEVRERLGLLEGQYAAVSRRLDRIAGDIEHIKRRLDLVEV